MWLPVTSGVASVCIGLTLWPSLASPADGLSLFGTAADARTQLDALLQRLPLLGRSGSGAFAGWSSPADHQDLGVANVSVHRVRYERGEEEEDASSPSDELHEAEDTLVRSLFGSAWAAAVQRARFTASGGGHAPSTSVVVTWEDHPLAASARPDAEAMCSAADGECTPSESPSTPKDKEAGRSVLYEVQVWVNGWGLDAFWHPANRRLTTSDPFVVVDGLPHEQEELGVRVRMKVQTRARLIAGLWFLTSEAEGPWSNVVTLSPAAEPALATLFAFFASHQVLGAVLVLLVAISTLVILRLVATGRNDRARKGKRSKSETKLLTVPASSVVGDTDTDADVDEPRPPKSRVRSQFPPFQPKRRRVASVDLEQEVADLHQELADSEAEVRRLMLFRGYGIDELRENELEELEHELRRTLKLVQKRRRLQHFESLEETEEEEDDDERENDTVVGGAVGKGTLGTVIEEDAH
jgi:hypothetical protein